MVAVACAVPAVSGRPVTHGTPRDLADEVITRRMVPTLSPRRIGRFVKRRGRETASVAILAPS
jgi:putative transposase